MPATWSECKERVEAQMDRDPQRATLAQRAIDGVEAGLTHLASAGYNFEIAPRGTLIELNELKAEPELPLPMNPLSIGDGQKIVTAKKSAVVSQFEAMSKNGTSN